MEITTTTTDQSPRRKAATSALATVGFITLIIIGIALAIYGARYVPVAFDRIGAAAVSLFNPEDEEPVVEVVESTIPFEPIQDSTATSSIATSSPSAPVTAGPSKPSGSSAGSVRYVPVTVPPPAPYGKADLTVDITAVGYCRSNDPSSFRSASRVPDSENGGIRFTVKNAGTNTSGRWDFAYELPTSPKVERTVSSQRSLGPGDQIDYTICFTRPRPGDDRLMTIRVDSGRDVDESNENNNSDSARIDIED